ncbi:hypothetical protein GCM10027091_04620 [Streptomyces daliensis]
MPVHRRRRDVGETVPQLRGRQRLGADERLEDAQPDGVEKKIRVRHDAYGLTSDNVLTVEIDEGGKREA